MDRTNGNSQMPLAGTRILDLTSVIMGPYATQMLAEYGADVVKVEPPEGDIMRNMGPHREPQMGPVYLNLNRGKRSVVLDMKHPESRRIMAQAVRHNDVFITNTRHKALKKLGLDWETLSRHNPRLIYVFLAGFAEDSEHAGKPAYDDLIQGMVALPSLVQQASGGQPEYIPINIADKTVGLFVVQTVLAALLERISSGQGQYIEIPMYETMAGFVLSDHMGAATFADEDSCQAGNPRLLSLYRRPYRTADGWISTIVYTDKHWESFLRLMGDEHLWHTDDRFQSMANRTNNIDAVYAYVEKQLVRKSTATWMRLLSEADIPVAPVAQLGELIDALEQRANSVIGRYQGSKGQRYRGINPSIQWQRTPLRAGAKAPYLGEHTEQVLAEWGSTDD
ncbi:CaiB/BaiF CoA transferase family protein [Alicycliphilus denitrificans]|uniref:CaiB/BaiF CoA transferase family protein n=1 Tax=Alicycliphilus denitrificans TaxID=179636 RepID=UPI003A80B78C